MTEGHVNKNGSEIGSKVFPRVQETPYPKRVFLIIGNKFCERLTYYGLTTILVLYLKYKLGYTENDATVLFHSFSMMSYFMCLVGAIICDVSLGKFKTILYFSIVYLIGSTIVVLSSIPTLNISPKITLFVGLSFIAIGCGIIKPCVTALGGDQFKLPEQAAQAATFFSIFYFGMNLGILISTSMTPVLREDVHCFGDNDCFPLAFGVLAIVMFISIVILLAGRTSYTYLEVASENMLVQVFRCITNAISTKIREGRENPRRNLLDYSIDKYGEQLVSDTRVLLQIVVLYLPFPLFWALFDQQASRWTFQANKMNGDIGFYTIKPDQMQTLNPFLVVLCIPMFEIVIYPILKRIGIRRPLQKMVIGGILAAVAFLISALVQFKIESSPEKSLNMLWQLPQYAALSVGEVMFSPTGLSFSYEEAPTKMKSVVQALWQLTVAIGDLILLSIAELSFFNSQAHEFLLFSGLMFVGMLIFAVLAYNFKSKIKIEKCVPMRTLGENVSL